jgi:peroxiredoxin
MRIVTSVSFALLIVVISITQSYAVDVTPLELGASAPNFSLPGVDGKTHTLNDYADAAILVIVFTCNHCPTAQAYEDRLINYTNEYQPKGVQFVMISPNDDKSVRLDELGYTDLNDSLEDMKKRANDKHFPFPYLYDGETQTVTTQYGAAATPHAYVFDQDQKLRYRGAIDNSEDPSKTDKHFMVDAINALLAGKEITATDTKPFGCSIKWADKRESANEAVEKWNQETATLETLNKEQLTALMKNDSDKLRVINVWATWCAPCVEEFPTLIEIHRMYRKRPFELITISGDTPEKKSEVLNFLNEHHASTRNFIYEGHDKSEMMAIIDEKAPGAIPHTILVMPGGEIVYRHTDAIDPHEVKREIVKHIGNTYYKTLQ